jgi:hypothetical protein
MKIELTRLRLLETGLRRFWPFRSAAQLQSYLLCVLVPLVGLGALAQSVWHAHVIGIPAVAGAFGGALPSVYLARPARFGVKGPGRAQALAALEAHLPLLGFQPSDTETGLWVCRKRPPQLLRWNQQAVHLAIDANTVWVSGHYAGLLSLRRYLRQVFPA